MKKLLNSQRAIATKTAAIIVAAIVVIAAVGGASYWYLAGRTAPEVEPIKIGLLLPLSGRYSTLAKLHLQSYNLVKEWVNTHGGIKSLNGANITWVLTDTQSDPDVGISQVERLITVDGLKILTGSYSSANAYPQTAAAAKYPVIYWETSATVDGLTDRGFRYLIRANAKSEYIAGMPWPFIRDYLKPKRVAIAYEESEAWVSYMDLARELIETEGGDMEIVADIPYSGTALDYTSLILQLKEAEPDFLYQIGYTDDHILFVRQCEELGFSPPAWHAGAALSDPYFYEMMGLDADYLFGAAYYTSDMEVPGAFETPWGPITIEEYRKMHFDAYGEEPTLQSAFCFTASMALPIAINLAGSLEPEAIREAALELDIDYTTTAWSIKFVEWTPGGSLQNTGADKGVIAQVQDGEFLTIYPLDFASTTFWHPIPPWEER